MKVNKIKDKVADKKMKCKAKVKAKCGAKVSAMLSILALVFSGCHMGEVPTAQRAQTATTEVKFIVQDGGTATFTFGAEFVSLAQANETSGTESMTATPHNAPYVDTKPDIDVSVPVNKSGAAQSVGSVLGDAVAEIFKSSVSSTNSTTTAK